MVLGLFSVDVDDLVIGIVMVDVTRERPLRNKILQFLFRRSAVLPDKLYHKDSVSGLFYLYILHNGR